MGSKQPFLLDFFPLEDRDHTRIHPFFDALAEGRLTTTRCTGCGEMLWQPRVVCPACNSDALEWVDLPRRGRLFAFTEVHLGAPLGMEEQLPYVIGLVELDGVPVRLITRVAAPARELRIDQPLEMVVDARADGRRWFHFAPVGKP